MPVRIQTSNTAGNFNMSVFDSFIGFGLFTFVTVVLGDYASVLQSQEYYRPPPPARVYPHHSIPYPRQDGLAAAAPIAAILALGVGAAAVGVAFLVSAAAARNNIQNLVNRVTTSRTSLNNVLTTQNGLITTLTPRVTSTTTQVNILCAALRAVAATAAPAVTDTSGALAIKIDTIINAFMNNAC